MHPSVLLRCVVGYNRIPGMLASRTAGLCGITLILCGRGITLILCGLCGITLILENRAVRTLAYLGGPGSHSYQGCSFTHRGLVLRFVPVSPGSRPQENTL